MIYKVGLYSRFPTPKPRRNFFRFLWDNIFRGWYHVRTKFKYFSIILLLGFIGVESDAAIRIRAMQYEIPNSSITVWSVAISSSIILPDGTTVYIAADGTSGQHFFTDGLGNWGWEEPGGGGGSGLNLLEGGVTEITGAAALDFNADDFNHTVDGSTGILTIAYTRTVSTDSTQTLVGKTLTSPVINTPAMSANSIDTITEIAAALKTGSDGELVTGTAGSDTDCAQWNADGDLVTAGAACGSGSGGAPALNILDDGATEITGAAAIDAGYGLTNTVNGSTGVWSYSESVLIDTSTSQNLHNKTFQSSVTVIGVVEADGLTMDQDENITLGGQTFDHDGLDFVFSDTIHIEASTVSAVLHNTTDGVSNESIRFIGNTRSSPQDDDSAYAAYILTDSGGNEQEFVRWTWEATDITDGSEDGNIHVEVMHDGSFHDALEFHTTVSGQDTTIWNTGNQNIDYLIKSDNDSEIFFIDSSLDTLTIGSLVSLAKFAVDGDQDEIQLLIQGNDPQTANLIVFEKSDGVDLFTLTNDGALTVLDTVQGSTFNISGASDFAYVLTSVSTLAFAVAGSTQASLLPLEIGFMVPSRDAPGYNPASGFGLFYSSGAVNAERPYWKDANGDIFDMTAGGGGGGGSGDITDVFDCSTGDCNSMTIASGEKLDGGTATSDATGEGIILGRATDCSAATDEGHSCWDTDNDVLYVGDGSAAKSVTQKFYHSFDPGRAKLPGTDPCVISNSTTSLTSSLLCDSSTNENVSWSTILHPYSGGGIDVSVYWTMVSTDASSVVLISSIACITPGDSVVLDSKTFAAGASVTQTVPTTIGHSTSTTISPTDDSCSENDILVVYVEREGSSGSDDAPGDIEIRKVFAIEP